MGLRKVVLSTSLLFDLIGRELNTPMDTELERIALDDEGNLVLVLDSSCWYSVADTSTPPGRIPYMDPPHLERDYDPM